MSRRTVNVKRILNLGLVAMLLALAVMPGLQASANPVVSLNDGDFVVAVIPDTQHYTDGNAGNWTAMATWLAANKDTLNIQAVIGEGDLVQQSDVPAQWVTIATGWNIIKAAGIPTLIGIGNHDYDKPYNPGVDQRLVTVYDSYFPESYFSSSTIGGTFNGTMDNYWSTLTVDGIEYLFLQLEFFPRDSVLSWAQTVIDAHPDALCTVTTHGYLDSDGTRTIVGDPYAPDAYAMTDYNDGQQMWDEFIKVNPNIRIVLSGHQIALQNSAELVSSNDAGNLVYQYKLNWQDDGAGGSGRIVLLKFRPDIGYVGMTTYSPITSSYDTAATYSMEYDSTPWWDANWSTRISFSANMSGVTENLTNFPTKVHIDSTMVDFSDFNADLSDVRFLAMDGSTVLNTENSSYDPTAQTADFWVSSNWTALGDYSEYITMYYGNPAAPALWATSTVWSNAGAVSTWHLDATSNNGTSVFDSSGNGYTLTSINTTWTPAGRVFAGANDSFLERTVANYRNTDNVGSIQVWFNTAASGVIQEFFASADNATNNHYLQTFILNTDNLPYISQDSTGHTRVKGGVSVTDGINHQLLYSTNGSAWYIELDSVSQNITVASGSNSGNWFDDTTSADGIQIGAVRRTSVANSFNGTISEVSVYNKQLSTSEGKANWMSMIDSFLSQNAPSLTTLPATDVSMSKDAVVSGNFSGNVSAVYGVSLDYWWEFGDDITYGNSTANTTDNTTGVKTIAFSTSNLTPGATVHFRFNATNENGTTYGSDEAFALTMPTVTTGAATVTLAGTGRASGTLTADTTDMGVASSAYVSWRYGNNLELTTDEQVVSATGDVSTVFSNYPQNGSQAFQSQALIRVGTETVEGNITEYTFANSGGMGAGLVVLMIIFAIAGGLSVTNHNKKEVTGA